MILVMKDGHIIEQGNHESLLAKNGFYAKLYNSRLLYIAKKVLQLQNNLSVSSFERY